ncbi:YicC family protein [Gilliamella sp. B2776]|uniref:YicC/YloC family endoribonuclease n=1 Tax=unclassified Gilliamella TaxID=2685620 RepID=UPI002269D386|nr:MULTISPECIES: YicC/YloC family endoribonuclease [unclassified Gilliamella]MCX8650811.1 YicC family protein [Gilliamella sp. B2779]MCX8654210.1 YicC family protein [Gilliamella sp. B2737]MCX8664870.1 YicC family protein [Gilliamella sp. B2887]MCX8692645.1 YicC family protein [Gilliamella sp. B2776]MCX8697466.1 YicC family protein [Gilliamella sp. B3000]
MISSMTAYARKEMNQSWGTASWELRSVNQRYLETYIRMPEQFRSLEPIIRERLRSRLTRGKIECNLRFELDPASQHQELSLNQDLAKQVLNAVHWIQTEYKSGDVNPIDVLRWPGVLSAKEQNLDTISQEIVALLDTAIDELIAVREREGEVLRDLIIQRLESITVEVEKIRQWMPQILEWQKERLHNKLAEANLELDKSRLEQEIVLMAQRIDVAEELDRLMTHVKETYAILKKNEAIGRRLDFMMQEFNRESNTIASKSINADVTASAIELKVLIEQIREQVQNIE